MVGVIGGASLKGWHLFPITSVQVDRTEEDAIAAVPQFAVPHGRRDSVD